MALLVEDARNNSFAFPWRTLDWQRVPSTTCFTGSPQPFPVYNETMNRITRTGFEVERKLTLDEEDDRGVVANATAAQRLAMVWPITASCWALVPGSKHHAEREFQRHVVCVRRGQG